MHPISAIFFCPGIKQYNSTYQTSIFATAITLFIIVYSLLVLPVNNTVYKEIANITFQYLSIVNFLSQITISRRLNMRVTLDKLKAKHNQKAAQQQYHSYQSKQISFGQHKILNCIKIHVV